MKGKRPAGLSGNSYWPIASPAGVRLSAFRIRRLLLAAEIGKPIGSDRPGAAIQLADLASSKRSLVAACQGDLRRAAALRVPVPADHRAMEDRLRHSTRTTGSLRRDQRADGNRSIRSGPRVLPGCHQSRRPSLVILSPPIEREGSFMLDRSAHLDAHQDTHERLLQHDAGNQ